MCGILTVAGDIKEFRHQQMSSLRKRGPDEIGFWTDGKVFMGHSRLSIIGLDERSNEPMSNERYVLSYNGEIYNFLEIAERLNSAGHSVGGGNDAKVLLHAWSKWGQDVLTDLSGFWAFTIYDKVENKLFLVRDQLGIKPMYYWVGKDKLYVSSLIKTILEVAEESPELDYTALSEYAQYQFTFGDKTFIKQIRKVLPGHVLEISLDDFSIKDRCYEDIFVGPSSGDGEPLTNSWLDETAELVRECILESTISDTSFTTFCSGGIDSSLITSIAQPELAYHCNYSDPDCNETFFAQRVVEGKPIRLFVVNAEEKFNLVGRLSNIVEDFDELTIGSVILPLDDLLSQVKRRYKVILTGTGGDELFAGYVRYMLTLGECNQDNYRELFEKVRKLPSAAERFELCHKKGRPEAFTFFQPEVRDTFMQEFERCCYDDNVLRSMLRFDLRYFLAGLLNIDDKMCGRHSLESRPSLLHQKLVRRMQAVEAKPEAFLRNGELKPILRDIALKYLPTSVVKRKDKMGFTTPVGTFVNESAHLIREQITNSHFKELYDLKQVNFTARTKYSREIFGLSLLDLWLNKYIKR